MIICPFAIKRMAKVIRKVEGERPAAPSPKIICIKEFRTLTGCGLLEAELIYEAAEPIALMQKVFPEEFGG